MHPDQICQYHPNCMRGSSCQYYHLSVDGGSFASSMQMARHPTACLYGVRCTNQACSFTHPTLHKLQPIVADRSTITCRFGTSCRNGFACPFSHANGLLERPGRDARPATLTSGGEVGEACVMDDMTDRRINGRSGASAASSITSCSEMVASAPSERQLCRFDKKCQKIDCGLWHPLRDRDLRHLVEKEINK